VIRIVDVGGRVDRELRGGEDYGPFFLSQVKSIHKQQTTIRKPMTDLT